METLEHNPNIKLWPLRSRRGPPRRLDKVYKQGKEPQPNGYICRVLWDDREVLVRYLDTPRGNGRYEYFDWDELEGRWCDRLSGFYMIYQEG